MGVLRPRPRRTLSAAAVLALSLSVHPAHALRADDAAPPPSPDTLPPDAPPSESPPTATAPPEAPPPPPHRWAVGLNPLAFALGRYGGDIQRLVLPGNALVINVHADYASSTWQSVEYDRSAPLWGFGGELGWRIFTGSDAMRGFFLGASLIAGWYSVDYNGYRFGLPGFGFAADMGGQADIGRDWFMTFGGGVQHLWTRTYPQDIAPGVSFVMGAGWDPRLLLTIGMRVR